MLWAFWRGSVLLSCVGRGLPGVWGTAANPTHVDSPAFCPHRPPAGPQPQVWCGPTPLMEDHAPVSTGEGMQTGPGTAPFAMHPVTHDNTEAQKPCTTMSQARLETPQPPGSSGQPGNAVWDHWALGSEMGAQEPGAHPQLHHSPSPSWPQFPHFQPAGF